VPKQGGTLVEGIVGTPRFVNPLLATSLSDKDLVSVIYAGLMTRTANNELSPELAERYTVSEDGLTYTFHLRHNISFHDGTPITADDVVFTVTQAANPALRSPLSANWEGVDVVALDPHTVAFTLPEPYSPFIENTTLGILPAHIWGGLSDDEFAYSQFNATPVGAGPYRVDAVVVDQSGIPERYDLVAFPDYVLGAPNIARLQFAIFGDKGEALRAYQEGRIDSLYANTPASHGATANPQAMATAVTLTAPQLRTFAVFLNHNRQPLFMRKPVREALDLMTPREEVVRDILGGYAEPLSTPIPDYLVPEGLARSVEGDEVANTEVGATSSHDAVLARAQGVLEKAGWERGEDGVYAFESDDEVLRLAFSLSTSDVPELAKSAERIAQSWRELGAEVEVKIFSAGDLTQSVIRPRRHDALLFGMDIGHELDLYVFWHSSQRNDPGLNIAQFADIEADAAVTALRKNSSPEVRSKELARFLERVASERAALFVYAPQMTYQTRARIHNISLHPIATPSERFDTIHEWYIETDRVWPLVRDLVD
jgi:peptide/nickel transport system substrate-binding protein